MANLLYANNAVGTLAAPISNSATSVTLNAGQAALFPNPSAPQVFYATITDAATQTIKEIVKVTAVSGNIFSITRGQDGTSALSWNINDIIEQCAIRLEMQGWENAAEGQFGIGGLNVAITPSTTLGIVGTTAADNANAGSVGEFNGVLQTGPLAVSFVPVTVASLSLTAGDWDVWGTAIFVPSPSTTVQAIFAGLSQTTNALPSTGNFSGFAGNFTAGQQQYLLAPMQRFNLSGTTTIFLVGEAQFGVSGCQINGLINARRVR